MLSGYRSLGIGLRFLAWLSPLSSKPPIDTIAGLGDQRARSYLRGLRALP